jgi:hypothetical protein
VTNDARLDHDMWRVVILFMDRHDWKTFLETEILVCVTDRARLIVAIVVFACFAQHVDRVRGTSCPIGCVHVPPLCKLQQCSSIIAHGVRRQFSILPSLRTVCVDSPLRESVHDCITCVNSCQASDYLPLKLHMLPLYQPLPLPLL